jgi:hypothetical protein
MRKPISTKTHAILDYLTISSFVLLPRVLGFSKELTRGMDAVAITKLAYTLLTRHELGAYKVLPMKAHLAMDVAGGAMLAALPFAVGEEDPAAIGTCVAMGVFDIAAAPLTETEPRPDSQWPGETVARRIAETTTDTVTRAGRAVGAWSQE